MSDKFAEHKGLDLTATNKSVLEDWNKNDVFHKSITEREGCPQFVFFEGPPSANGHPGIHHVLARTIKDTFNRYKTMKGYQVHRKAGWDTHGLPVELGVEKELGITKADIDNKESDKYISVEDYNRKCRENVMKFTAEWRDLTEKMGYWVDLDHPYITYDNKYIETLWWLLKQLYDKGLLYKGYTIQPYSPAAGTGLSSHELNQPGCYRDVKDTTATVQFLMKDPKPEMAEWGKPYFLAWTTTPWTLAANSALCVGPNIDYVAVQTYNSYSGEPVTVVMAEVLVASYFSKEGEGADLASYKKGDKVKVDLTVEALPEGRTIRTAQLNISAPACSESVTVRQTVDASVDGIDKDDDVLFRRSGDKWMFEIDGFGYRYVRIYDSIGRLVVEDCVYGTECIVDASVLKNGISLVLFSGEL